MGRTRTPRKSIEKLLARRRGCQLKKIRFDPIIEHLGAKHKRAQRLSTNQFQNHDSIFDDSGLGNTPLADATPLQYMVSLNILILISNSKAVGWDSWLPTALKAIFRGGPIFKSASWFFVIILKFIFTLIFEIKFHEKNPWHQKISFLKAESSRPLLISILLVGPNVQINLC